MYFFKLSSSRSRSYRAHNAVSSVLLLFHIWRWVLRRGAQCCELPQLLACSWMKTLSLNNSVKALWAARMPLLTQPPKLCSQERELPLFEEIEEENSERMEQHLLCLKLTHTVRCEHAHSDTQRQREIWSHAHQCKQCKYQAVSATVITEAATPFFVSKRNESKHALKWKTLPVIIHPPINYHCGNTGQLHYIQTIENKAIFCQHREAENQSVLEPPVKGETQSCFRMAPNNHSATYCTPKGKKRRPLQFWHWFIFLSFFFFTFYWWARTAT